MPGETMTNRKTYTPRKGGSKKAPEAKDAKAEEQKSTKKGAE